MPTKSFLSIIGPRDPEFIDATFYQIEQNRALMLGFHINPRTLKFDTVSDFFANKHEIRSNKGTFEKELQMLLYVHMNASTNPIEILKQFEQICFPFPNETYVCFKNHVRFPLSVIEKIKDTWGKLHIMIEIRKDVFEEQSAQEMKAFFSGYKSLVDVFDINIDNPSSITRRNYNEVRLKFEKLQDMVPNLALSGKYVNKKMFEHEMFRRLTEELDFSFIAEEGIIGTDLAFFDMGKAREFLIKGNQVRLHA